MTRILLVTGDRAFEVLSNQLKEIDRDDVEVEIYKLPIEVSAFTKPSHIQRQIDIDRYDWIIVSGMSPHNFSCLENTVKGPKNAYDITNIINNNQIDQLDPDIPADEKIELDGISQEKIDKYLQQTTPTTKIKDIEIGGDTPPKIISEIVDATKMDKQKTHETAKKRFEDGADIIDIGVHHNATKKEIQNTIDTIKKLGPTSIDTMNPQHIEIALKNNIDLVLSIDQKNIDQLKDKLQGTHVVVIGDKEKPSQIHKNIQTLKEHGAIPIADPILDPPGHGLTNSINRYIQFRKKDKETPLLMGIGNVTELIDTDSHAINALMTTIAMELNTSLILTTEASLKTKNSTKELKTAIKMVLASKIRGTTPKDIGPNLIKHKAKKRKEFKPKKTKKTIEARKTKQNTEKQENMDCYEIGIDRNKKQIYTTKYNSKTKKPITTITGKKPTTIINKITQKTQITPNHAAYLSKELKKAQIALKTGKNYIQDTPLYKNET